MAQADIARAVETEGLLRGSVSRYTRVVLVVGPPRSASTALARTFWKQPRLSWYSHEPFEESYYQGVGVDAARRNLMSPVAIRDLDPSAEIEHGSGLLIKEMTFQVGAWFPALAAVSTAPIVFIVRDPRLSVASRIAALRRQGRNELFPLRETGWSDLRWQLDYVRGRGIDHMIIDAHELRQAPERVVERVAEVVGLPYSPRLLDWRPSPRVSLSSLYRGSDPFYERVLASRGIQLPLERTPGLSEFPAVNGLREHVREALGYYRSLRPQAADMLKG